MARRRERELSLNAAADRIGMAWHTLAAMVDADPPQVTHRIRYGPHRRLVYIPLSEVNRLRGVVRSAAIRANDTKKTK